MTALYYDPRTHCCVCVNTEERQVSATRQVKNYRVCDAHADLIERAPSIQDALREVRRQREIGGVA